MTLDNTTPIAASPVDSSQQAIKPLHLHHRFIRPSSIDLAMWQNLVFDKEIDEEELLFHFATTTKYSRSKRAEGKKGRYYFTLPLLTKRTLEQEGWDAQYKALLIFTPTNGNLFINSTINNPLYTSERDPGKALLEAQAAENIINPYQVKAEDLDAVSINIIKNHFIHLLQDISLLQLEKNRNKRAYLKDKLGLYFVGICLRSYNWF